MQTYAVVILTLNALALLVHFSKSDSQSFGELIGIMLIYGPFMGRILGWF